MELFKKVNFKQFFTLIELIVVIVVIGILAAIVIPNISSFKEEATETAIKADTRNIQTAVDMFMLDYPGTTPTKEKATLGNPQIVELYGLKPNYLRDLPKDKQAKFWLDQNNTVWGSKVDAPLNVTYDHETKKLSWDTVDGATLYKIYTSSKTVKSAASAASMKFKKDVEATIGGRQEIELETLTDGMYLVTALDKFDFESPATGENSQYQGYGDGPEKDFSNETGKPNEGGNEPTAPDEETGEPTNPNETGNEPNLPNEPIEVPTIPEENVELPIAVIGLTPEQDIDSETTIVWDYKNSTDPNDIAIVAAEWKLNSLLRSSMPSKLGAGTHVVELRVKNEKGIWSHWARKEIFVSKMNFTTATFTNAGAVGATGPTQSQLDSAYARTELKGLVTSSKGIQIWKVPATGSYKIETFGAKGGLAGGNGAIMTGTFSLTKGETLKVLVGQMGTTKGGGGGTYVAKSTNTPLIVAGGGGGNKQNTTSNGTTSLNGKAGEGGASAGYGGQNGYGGGKNADEGASGGAGFYGNGVFYLDGLTTDSRTAQSFINGGKGSTLIWTTGNGGVGGFGGGGSGGWLGGGGGGGGYSGGGAAGASYSAAGGGGSYNAGTNKIITGDSNSNHGKVIITLLTLQ